MTTPALMTAAEELALIERWRAGDQRALDKLIHAHQPLVKSVARRYRSPTFAEDDIMQEGNIGLLLALDKFDPTRGFRLNTFARHWIRATIRVAMDTNRCVMRVPRGPRSQPRIEVPKFLPLDKPLSPGGTPWIEMTASEAPSPEDIAVRSGEVQRLRRSMRKLKPRDRFVIEQRMDEDTTLREIGIAIGVTHERARQIEQRALRSLKADLTMPRAVEGGA